MEMVEEMDAGNYYSQFEIKINDDDTVSSMFVKIGDLIYDKTAQSIIEIDNGLESIQQNEEEVTF